MADFGKIARSLATRIEGTSGHTPKSIATMAEQYIKDTGLAGKAVAPVAKANPERGAKIAQAFEDMKHDPNNLEVRSAYNSLINETNAQFEKIKKAGLKLTAIEPGQPNPYKNSKEMVKDVQENGHMYYYPTEQGFGTETKIADHPLLQDSGHENNGKPLLANDVFRIVHDYFGHAKEGNKFGAMGEENAWRSHLPMYSPEAQKALTSETRGQNSWVNYGPKGEANRANPAATTYADQKAGILPEWTREDVSARLLPTTTPRYGNLGQMLDERSGDSAKATESVANQEQKIAAKKTPSLMDRISAAALKLTGSPITADDIANIKPSEKRSLADAMEKTVAGQEAGLSTVLDYGARPAAAVRSGVAEAQRGLDPQKIGVAIGKGLANPANQAPAYSDLAETAGVTSPLALTAIQTAGEVLEPQAGFHMLPGVAGTVKKVGPTLAEKIIETEAKPLTSAVKSAKVYEPIRMTNDVNRVTPIRESYVFKKAQEAKDRIAANKAAEVPAMVSANPAELAKRQSQALEMADRAADASAMRTWGPKLEAAKAAGDSQAVADIFESIRIHKNYHKWPRGTRK